MIAPVAHRSVRVVRSVCTQPAGQPWEAVAEPYTVGIDDGLVFQVVDPSNAPAEALTSTPWSAQLAAATCHSFKVADRMCLPAINAWSNWISVWVVRLPVPETGLPTCMLVAAENEVVGRPLST